MSEASFERGRWIKPDEEAQDVFEQKRERVLSDVFRVTVTIAGKGGAELFGDTVTIFDSPNTPEEVTSYFMTNATAFRGITGREPPNSFFLTLDFSKPPLLDGREVLSAPTQNNSELTVSGNEMWVAAVTDAVMQTLNARKTNRNWLHAPFAYDIGLMILAFPLGLYTCWKVSGPIASILTPISSFLSGAAFVYVALICAWIYRAIYGYAKWAFPIVELSGVPSSSSRHRYVLSALLLAIAGTAIYDALKLLS